ncbi:MAG: putative toxin-antitoxin system toxin component, PIN family [Saprospirales bacterium]|jgi:putative PIN family toxin of toxin-antitoxin system|nr:putative toxin-antitoxin system toxin component, PIN family [Saprospirales bacterium]
MNTTAVKIVLDTNVFISCIGKSSPFRWIFEGILEGRFLLCLSHEILLEYQEVLGRKTTAEITENITQFLHIYPHVLKTEIFYNWQLIALDQDDNKFVDCSVAANAFCIISNDKHFKPFRNHDFPPLRVMTTSEFEAEYKLSR